MGRGAHRACRSARPYVIAISILPLTGTASAQDILHLGLAASRLELPAVTGPRLVSLRIDLERYASPAPPSFALEQPAEDEPSETFELRDNSIEGEWARQQDFELVLTWSSVTVAFNNHLLNRKLDDAQVTATISLEY